MLGNESTKRWSLYILFIEKRQIYQEVFLKISEKSLIISRQRFLICFQIRSDKRQTGFNQTDKIHNAVALHDSINKFSCSSYRSKKVS